MKAAQTARRHTARTPAIVPSHGANLPTRLVILIRETTPESNFLALRALLHNTGEATDYWIARMRGR
jgi:hypothetical protein